MSDQDAKSIWEQLKKAIQQIHDHDASQLSFEELYRNAYNLVLHKHGEMLYGGVCRAVRDHLTDVAKKVIRASDGLLLRELAKEWEDHQQTMMMVRDILMYMDRTYVTQQKKKPIYDHGLEIFRDSIARHDQVKDRLRRIILEWISKERAGQQIDRMLLRSTLSMLADLGVDTLAVYEDDFESDFLETTRTFYRQESLEFISANTCPDYLSKAETRLNEELMRVQHYLNVHTKGKLMRIVEKELISVHSRALVDMENSGVVAMLKNNKVADLRRMYSLFSRVPETLDHLRGCMCNHVKKEGLGLVADQEKVSAPVDFVKKLLEMRDKYDKLVTDALNAENKSQKRLKEAFEDFINADSRCASYLVAYIDELLKSALKGLSEGEADTKLDKVIVIFRYLQDKDIFENFYKDRLSKRLLNGRSVSEDAEKSMVAKLKTEMGYQFTSKLEGMFNDMSLSKDIMQKFLAASQNGDIGVSPLASSSSHSSSSSSADTAAAASSSSSSSSSGSSTSSSLAASAADVQALPQTHVSVGEVKLEVNVLTTGYWPSQNVEPCRLPPEIVSCSGVFENFYHARHTGRKLTWQTSLGNADVRARFSGFSCILSVSTYQMCILMEFNGKDQLNLEDLSELGIPPHELKRQLISMCTPRHRIFIKSPKGKEIKKGDTFTVNEAYTSKLKRVKIPLVSAKETSM
jgi:cullin 3